MLYFFSLFILFFFGLACGSFLNAWVYRTRVGQSIVNGRSHCPHCKHQLQMFDLVPLFSFVFLRGKCRYCHKKISVQYPLVELTTGILFVLVPLFRGYILSELLLLNVQQSLPLLRDLFIIFFLEFVFVYDLLYGEIPFFSTLMPGLLLFVVSLFSSTLSLSSLLLGMAVGTLFFLAQFLVSKGAWIGGGDIGLGFFMGISLGFPLILIALFLAYVGGSLVLLPFLALKKLNKKSKIPFGTFLSVATFLAMMWGEKILSLF